MTPTCRTCDAKFPGKHTCKHCGADPNATPTVVSRVQKILRAQPTKPKSVHGRRRLKSEIRSVVATKGKKKLKHGRRY